MNNGDVITRNKLRCHCSRTPLLAVYGIHNNRPYVHIRVFKQSKIYGEIVSYGTCKILCRECHRWFTVTIKQGLEKIVVEEGPQESPVPPV